MRRMFEWRVCIYRAGGWFSNRLAASVGGPFSGGPPHSRRIGSANSPHPDVGLRVMRRVP